MKSLPIYEYFHSWQGEGLHMGRSAFFIRTFGCSVGCDWCDTAETWHPDYRPEAIFHYTADTLAELAAAASPEFVVITGGEPTLHDLAPLTKELHARHLPCHLETCGAFRIRGDFDWITLSPKLNKKPLPDNIGQTDEIKLVIENENSLDVWIDTLAPWITSHPIWLHPEWSQRHNKKVLEAISRKVKEAGAPFRAGYQLHKLYEVDALDLRCRIAACASR